MEKQEQYLALRARFIDYTDKLMKLQGELRDLGAKQDALDNAAFKAEALGESGVKGKREEAERNAARISAIKAEIEKPRRAIEILEKEMKKIEVEIAEEIRTQHRPDMEKAYRAYVKTLREAAAAEVEIERVQEAANEAGRLVGIVWNINLEPTGSIRQGVQVLVGQTIVRAKMNDYDVA